MLATLAFVLATKPVLEINLKPSKPSFVVGEEIKFTAPTKNVGEKPVLVVPQNDSMQGGRKSPLCQIQFRPIGTEKWLVPPEEIGCGNTNPAKPEDFVALKPGASVDLLAGMDWCVLEIQHFSTTPGTYEFRLVYDTSKPIESWIGGPLVDVELARAMNAIRPLFDQVPKGVFVSKTAKIQLVVAPIKTERALPTGALSRVG